MTTKKEVLEKISGQGFYEINPKSQYEIMRLTGPCIIILYNTGKLSIQGKKEIAEKYKTLFGLALKKEAKKKNVFDEENIIVGSDETLKGDSFGGLVVCGFRANKEARQKLRDIGVADSKTILDAPITLLAEKIKKEFSKNYHIINLFPADYNMELEKGNSTKLLNKLHKEVNEQLKTKKSIHVVDEYPGCRVGDIREQRAESKYPEVAAASIIARAEGLKQLDFLSQKAGFKIPKGSTHVSMALKKLKQKKLSFKLFAKLNFSNVKKFL
jgi:ribonuclease HIII